MHPEAPSIAIREGAVSGRWATRAVRQGSASPALVGSVTLPWEGASHWERAGVQQSKQPRGAATCKSCPVASPVLPGAERRRRERKRREPSCERKAGPAKDGSERTGWGVKEN